MKRTSNMSLVLFAVLTAMIVCASPLAAQDKAATPSDDLPVIQRTPAFQEGSPSIGELPLPKVEAPPPLPEAKVQAQEFSDKGLKIDFSIRPLLGGEVTEGGTAEIRFRITDATTGSPIVSLFPGSWVDQKTDKGSATAIGPMTCQDKMKAFFQGVVQYRPMIDLNGYYLLAMNNDASISVIDPYVSLMGRTSLFAQIILKGYPEDWSYGVDEKHLFVTIPRENLVNVVDTERFGVVKSIPAGPTPTRIELQPDKKYLWVGNDSSVKGEGGVTVIDVVKQQPVKTITTGEGRHEIAFTEDSLFAFVTNSKDDTLSVVDVQKLEKVKDIPVGAGPVSIAYSALSKAAYVADYGQGEVVVIDGKSFKETARVKLKPGLSVVRFAPGDRWAFVANARENVVHIVDSSTNTVIHTVEVEKDPYQIAFSKTFAYVRAMGDPVMTLIDYTTVGKEEKLRVSKIQSGDKAPGESRYHSVADTVLPTFMEGHVLVANPGDERVHYYMEGMSSMMGSFRSYGGQVPKAVLTVNRNLKPVEPGVYATTIRVPAGGDFDVAIFLDSPRMGHCFNFTAKASPMSLRPAAPDWQMITKEAEAGQGKVSVMQVKIFNTIDSKPIEGVKDLVIQTIHSTGMPSNSFMTRHSGEGVYDLPMLLPVDGAYYGVLTSKSRGWNPQTFHPLILLVKDGRVTVKKPTGEGK